MIIFHFLFSHFLDLNWCYCFAVKYEACLDDGTLIKKSDDDGVEFTLNDGQLVVQSLPTTFIIHSFSGSILLSFTPSHRSFLSCIINRC